MGLQMGEDWRMLIEVGGRWDSCLSIWILDRMHIESVNPNSESE